ncbi:MAG TPA: hypothetical protein VHL58_18545 [Thermoanaerobaculia bacterium]|nr:hypothetical protein [Thermoanaerobaculia bacterium]
MPAHLGGVEVEVRDLGILGAGIRQLAPLPTGFHTTLVFEREKISLPCTLTRCETTPAPEGMTYWSGVEFDLPDPANARALRELMVREINAAIDEWKKNARGELPDVLDHLPLFDTADRLVQTRSPKRSRHVQSYMWHRLMREKWVGSFVLDPAQPLDGFALPAEEPADQTALLRRAYEISDEQGRTLIRLMAQLAIAGIEG